MNNVQSSYITTQEAEALTRFQTDYFKKKRRSGELAEGIHWIKLGKSRAAPVRWNKALLLNWIQNYNYLETHIKFIYKYFEDSSGYISTKRSDEIWKYQVKMKELRSIANEKKS